MSNVCRLCVLAISVVPFFCCNKSNKFQTSRVSADGNHCMTTKSVSLDWKRCHNFDLSVVVRFMWSPMAAHVSRNYHCQHNLLRTWVTSNFFHTAGVTFVFVRSLVGLVKRISCSRHFIARCTHDVIKYPVRNKSLLRLEQAFRILPPTLQSEKLWIHESGKQSHCLAASCCLGLAHDVWVADMVR